jgi:hypothetical protein
MLRECCLASASVTQVIAACFIEIDRYLVEYQVGFKDGFPSLITLLG